MTIQELLDKVPWRDMILHRVSLKIRHRASLLCPICAAFDERDNVFRHAGYRGRGADKLNAGAFGLALQYGMSAEDANCLIRAADYENLYFAGVLAMRQTMLDRMQKAADTTERQP